MGQLVLLVVAAAWAAVLVPPLLRSRIENRPNSSVTDFANQLSSLQRAMPPRGVAMRSLARPLAPSPLSRPAAPGRPGLRSGVRTHSGATSPARTAPPRPVVDRTRVYDATPRPRSHGERRAATAARSRNALKRRRANVLFVLALIAGCSLFLAATTKVQALLWFSCAAFTVLCVYVYVLGQLRQRDEVYAPEPVARQFVPQQQVAHRRSEVHRHHRQSVHRSAVAPSTRRWSAAGCLIGRRYTRGPRGCSSVGRAQQSHC